MNDMINLIGKRKSWFISCLRTVFILEILKLMRVIVI